MPSSAPACARSGCGDGRSCGDYPDIVELVGLCDINPLRVEVAKAADGRHVPDLHQLRRHAHEGEAGHRDGDDRRRFSQPVSRPCDGARHRRDDREADGHRRSAVPCGARCREEDRPQDRRHPQLPLRAQAPEDQGAADGRRDREDHVGRFQLVSRHDATAPTTSAAGTGCGQRADRSGCTRRRTTSISSTGGSTPSRFRCRRSAASRTTGRVVPSATPTAARVRTRTSVPTTGTSTRTGTSSRSTTSASRPTAISATAACSRKTSTSSDTMNAVVRYSNGANMSYSVNTFMPVEGYYLAFNGTKGRLEVRDYERQPWDPGDGNRDQPDQEFRQARQGRDSDRDRGTRRR